MVLCPVYLTMVPVWQTLVALAAFGVLTSTIFLGLVLLAARRYRRLSRIASATAAATPVSLLPAVSILKPVHGMEAQLEEDLESFFQQDYPSFEVIIGARDANDPALQVAERVRKRYPRVPSQIVLSGFPTWPNAKVYSLEKMLAVAANSYLVLSDSDVHVGPDFLRNVIPPLLDPKLGLVTCPYQGVPGAGFGSTLEALGMSIEMPSGAMVADMLEGMRFALGPAVATRCDVLEGIGGISAVAGYYSDDFELGNKVWKAGLKVIFSHYIVGHVLEPRPFLRTLGDQLRWMKSTRYSRPAGHVGTGLTFAMFYGVLGCIAAAALGHPLLGLGLFIAAYLNRVVQALVVGWTTIGDRRSLTLSWLYPLRDFVGFFIWAGSFASSSFYWRGEIYDFLKGGKIVPRSRRAAPVDAGQS